MIVSDDDDEQRKCVWQIDDPCSCLSRLSFSSDSSMAPNDSVRQVEVTVVCRFSFDSHERQSATAV